MRKLGLQGAIRGKKFKTTIPDDTADRPLDLVNREFVADRPGHDLRYAIDSSKLRALGWEPEFDAEAAILDTSCIKVR